MTYANLNKIGTHNLASRQLVSPGRPIVGPASRSGARAAAGSAQSDTGAAITRGASQGGRS